MTEKPYNPQEITITMIGQFSPTKIEKIVPILNSYAIIMGLITTWVIVIF